jgi:trehalose 6-phosphate phosphatase
VSGTGSGRSQPPAFSLRPALPVPRTRAGQAGLAAMLRDPGRALIALDFDGTLSPIVADPAAARAHPGAVGALRRLAPLTGTLAVITGRPALDAVKYGRFDLVPGLLVLGHYSRERWEAGTLTAPPASPAVGVARRELPGVLATAGAPEGTWIEDKGDAVAVHTRRTARPDEALELLRGPLASLAERAGLVVEPGRFVIELRPAGADKGSALENLAMQRSPGAILFCGDDLGDGPAFSAVRSLRAAGIPGLAVCSGSAEVPGLAEQADLMVDGPDGVVALLSSLADAFGSPLPP